MEISKATFLKIATASVRAIALVEGWDADHPSWYIINGKVCPSREYKEQLSSHLEHQGITIHRSKYELLSVEEANRRLSNHQ